MKGDDTNTKCSCCCCLWAPAKKNHLDLFFLEQDLFCLCNYVGSRVLHLQGLVGLCKTLAAAKDTATHQLGPHGLRERNIGIGKKKKRKKRKKKKKQASAAADSGTGSTSALGSRQAGAGACGAMRGGRTGQARRRAGGSPAR